MISCLKALSFITEMVKLVKHANSESWFFFHGNKTQKNNNSKNLVGHKKGFSCIKRVSWMIDSCSSIEKYKWIIHELLSDTNILRLHIDFMNKITVNIFYYHGHTWLSLLILRAHNGIIQLLYFRLNRHSFHYSWVKIKYFLYYIWPNLNNCLHLH